MQAQDSRVSETIQQPEADRQLLQRLRMHAADAVPQLVADYGPAMTRAAYLYLGDAHAAEDVAQEVIVAVWDAAPRVTADTPLRSWLFGIVFRQCGKHRRSLWRRLRHEKVAMLRLQRERTDHGEPDERLERLREAVARLREDLRAVVILRFERNLSVAETAVALGAAEGTIKSRTHAAIEQLRAHMRSCDA